MEPEYESYNQYPNEILINYCGDNCDDEKDYFPKQNYFGRVSYCDITFNIDQITSTDCDENCIVCIKGSDKKCIVCRYLYEELSGGGKKCYGENDFPKTTIPTTLITTIPTTIIATVPTTIITTVPTTKSTIPTSTTEGTTKTKISTTEIEEPPILQTEITIKPNIPSSEITKNPTIQIETTIPKKEEENKSNDKSCSNEDILNNECKNGKMTINQIDNIKQNLLTNNYTKENTVIKTENVIMQLSTFEDQKDSDDPEVSNIDLGECENLLKDANNNF